MIEALLSSSDDATGFWTARLMKHTKDGRVTYSINECMYDSHGEIVTWTEDPVSIDGDSVDEIKRKIKMIQGAFGRPVLDGKTGEKA